MKIANVVCWIQLGIWAIAGAEWYLKNKDVMAFFNSNTILLVTIILGLCLSAYSLYLNYHPKIGAIRFSKKHKFLEIRDRKFDKEAVSLDGYAYLHCEFKTVTFLWDGTAPFSFQHCSFVGYPNITTKSDIVSSTVILLKAMQLLKQDVPLVLGDAKTPINVGVEVVP